MFEDDGPQEFDNEFQAARAAAHLEYNAAGKIGTDPLVQEALDAGNFAVVAVSTVYCPYTDAFLGTQVCLEAVMPDEGSARHMCNHLNALAQQDDLEYEVRCPKAVPAAEPELPDSDNIPF